MITDKKNKLKLDDLGRNIKLAVYDVFKLFSQFMQDLDSTKIDKITTETAINLVSLCNSEDPKFNGVAHDLILHLSKNNSANWQLISNELNSISDRALQGLSQ